jgi:serine/threonine protein kinase
VNKADGPTHICCRQKNINDPIFKAKTGEGASSAVFVGVNTVTGVNCASKRLRLAELTRIGDALPGLEREVCILRMFRHPHILELIEVTPSSSNRQSLVGF